MIERKKKFIVQIGLMAVLSREKKYLSMLLPGRRSKIVEHLKRGSSGKSSLNATED